MRALLLSGVVALVWGGAAVAAPIVGDASFEAVSTGAQGYVYDPKDTAGFGFSGYAGVARNGSAFGFGGAPDGSQVGFIQSYHGSSGGNIGQTIAGLTVGTTYTVSFDLAARAAPYAADPIFLLLTNTTGSGGGATGMSTSSLGTFTPTGTGFQAFTTASFVAGGSYVTLSFNGSNGAATQDLATAIDLVAVTPVGGATAVPEPAGLATFGAGLLATLAAARRRRG